MLEVVSGLRQHFPARAEMLSGRADPSIDLSVELAAAAAAYIAKVAAADLSSPSSVMAKAMRMHAKVVAARAARAAKMARG